MSGRCDRDGCWNPVFEDCTVCLAHGDWPTRCRVAEAEQEGKERLFRDLVESSDAAIAELRAEVIKAEAERDELIAAIDAARGHGHGMTPRDAVKDMSRMYSALCVDYQRLDNWLDETNKERDEARAEVAKLRVADREAGAMLAFRAEESRKADERNAALHAEVERLCVELARERNETKELRAELGECAAERDTATGKLTELIAYCDDAKRALGEDRISGEPLANAVKRLVMERDEAITNGGALYDRIEELGEQLRQVRTERDLARSAAAESYAAMAEMLEESP